MQAFEYARPKTVRSAAHLLARRWGETEILAGGTDLVSLMKDGVARPRRVVSLRDVAELRRLEFDPRMGLTMGSMVTLHELIAKPEVAEYYPAIVTAAQGVRSEQLQNMGTVGGDLLQRPRDWYYRNGYGLLAEWHGRSLIPNGENRYNAILGNSGPAYFVSPSSLAPILIALGGGVRLEGPRGYRDVPLERLYVIPKSESEREHSIRPDEVLTNVYVPSASKIAMAVYEVREKQALDWPLIAAAVALRLNDDKVEAARVILGQAAPIPWPCLEAEKALVGKKVTETVAAAAGQAAVHGARALSHNGYKIQLARVAVKRAVMAAVKGVA